MKKHLIAAAVAAAVAVPAMAQVTIYGSIDASYTSTNNVGPTSAQVDADLEIKGPIYDEDDEAYIHPYAFKNLKKGAGSVNSLNSSLLTTSRLGFRGEEDLGGGLKAGFVVESGIRNDSENALTLGDRGAEVFLSGGFGQIRVGKAATSDANTVASGPTNLTNFAAGTATRPDNRIQYITPTINGFSFNAAIATDAADDENTGDADKSNGKYNSFGFNYAAGPLRVMGFQARTDIESAKVSSVKPTCAADWSYEVLYRGVLGDNGSICDFDTNDDAIVTRGSKEVAAQDGRVKDTAFLASYDFGAVLAQVRYMTTKTSGDVTTEVDRKTTALDFTVPMADGVTLGLGYIRINNDADDTDSKKFSLYASKALSKRTNIYAAYATVNNDDKASIGATGSSERAPGTGENQRTMGVGIRHSF